MAPSIPSLALLGLLCVSTASAQQLLVYGSSALPTCAQNCQLLQSAQTGCIPPAAPVSSDTIYESCFCQSGYLTQLKTDPSAVCGTACSGSDLTQIATWYTNNCADGGVAAAAALSTAGTTTAPAATSTAPTTTQASTATSASATDESSSGSNSGGTGAISTSPSGNGSWWSQHWRWILAIIIIFVGLMLLLAIGLFLRRRHHARRDMNTTAFNQGITTRSMTMAPAAAAAGIGASPYGAGRDDSRMASMGTLGRVRERDREMMMGRQTPDYIESMRGRRGGTPVREMEQGQGKGKGRVQTQEDEIGAAK